MHHFVEVDKAHFKTMFQTSIGKTLEKILQGKREGDSTRKKERQEGYDLFVQKCNFEHMKKSPIATQSGGHRPIQSTAKFPENK